MTEHASDDAATAQRIVRVAGSRRARLTPVPGSDPNPEFRSASQAEDVPGTSRPESSTATRTRGPNDEQLRLDVPPHY